MKQELSTSGILSLFETDKNQRKSFVEDVIKRIEEGEIDPLKIHLQIKSMEDIIFQMTSLDEKKNKSVALAKRYRQALLQQAERHGSSFSLYNAKFEKSEFGTKYNYTSCNDPLMAELEAAAKAANDKLKERQELLRKIPSGGVEILHEDELIKVFPPTKISTTGIKISLK